MEVEVATVGWKLDTTVRIYSIFFGFVFLIIKFFFSNVFTCTSKGSSRKQSTLWSLGWRATPMMHLILMCIERWKSLLTLLTLTFLLTETQSYIPKESLVSDTAIRKRKGKSKGGENDIDMIDNQESSALKKKLATLVVVAYPRAYKNLGHL